jgi:hypothetical protein
VGAASRLFVGPSAYGFQAVVSQSEGTSTFERRRLQVSEVPDKGPLLETSTRSCVYIFILR